MNKKIILTFIGFYLPGYKSGGPVRTISNLLNTLSKDYSFKIITRDKDIFDNLPYEGIKADEWTKNSNCSIYYSGFKVGLRKIIKSTEFDLYYLNSLFDFSFSIKVILLLYFNLIPRKQIIIAPRGELSKGALSLKQFKKKIYLTIAKILKLYKNVVWHASNNYESDAIKIVFGEKAVVKIASDIPDFNLPKVIPNRSKIKNNLNIIFISSITPKKNLYFVIEILNEIEGEYKLDIYGPIKSNKYWQKCLNKINENHKNKITYKGSIPNSELYKIYPLYDLLFLPTLGENFGHVIFESLYYGIPVLSSGTTPWDKLDNFKAGWNINLNDRNKYIETIESLIKMDDDQFSIYRKGTIEYINWLKNNNDFYNDNLKLFL